jgi:hypothetical protein
LGAKKEMQGDIPWIVQGKGKESKKYGHFEGPLKELKDLFHVTHSCFI